MSNTSSVCTKCGNERLPSQGMNITSNKEKEYFFCVNCLKSAMHTLGVKADKTPDEIALLRDIRKFLKHEEN